MGGIITDLITRTISSFPFFSSTFRPSPLTPYHHLFDPATSVAAARPLLLAAGLYGSGSPHHPVPFSFGCSRLPSSVVSSVAGSPLDLTTLSAAANARAAAAAAVAVHPFLQLQKAAGKRVRVSLFGLLNENCKKKLRRGWEKNRG